MATQYNCLSAQSVTILLELFAMKLSSVQRYVWFVKVRKIKELKWLQVETNLGSCTCS